MWKQSSHVTGLREEYKKIYKAFQSKATQRKQRNIIYGLLDAQRVWQESCEKIEKEVVKYFQEIYSSSYPENLDSVLSKVHKTVTDKVNDLLAREYKEDEVAQPLLQMFPTKLLGLEDPDPQRYNSSLPKSEFFPIVVSRIDGTQYDPKGEVEVFYAEMRSQEIEHREIVR
ncbi:reverse transcriptase domain-containing protein [Fagus crenata]